MRTAIALLAVVLTSVVALAQTAGDYFLYQWDGTKFTKVYTTTFPPEAHTHTELDGYSLATDSEPDTIVVRESDGGVLAKVLRANGGGAGAWSHNIWATVLEMEHTDGSLLRVLPPTAWGGGSTRTLNWPSYAGTQTILCSASPLTLGNLTQSGATTGQAAVWNGTAWVPGTVSAPVTSVAGRTGAITLSTSDISGLGTMATQAANSVAITGGSITGVTELLSSDPDLSFDTHGNVTSKYWKIRNDVSNGVTLEMSVVSGAVPSTPGGFVKVASVSSGIVFISPGGSGIMLGGTTYLNNNIQSSLSSDGDRMMQLGNDSSTPGDAVFHGPDGSGTNITGGKTIIRGGNGTGTGGSGAWELQTSPVGSSGSTANTPRATLRGNKDGTIDSPTMPVESASDPASTHKLTIYVNGVRYKLLAIQE